MESPSSSPSMKANHIDLESFKSALERYPNHVPEKLGLLEDYRMKELPIALKTRIEAGKDVYLAKEELTKLVEWKLKHGTFRPRLLQLVTSNSDADIKKAIGAAFKSHQTAPDAVANSNAITSLKGIGIATASLIMSTLDPDNVPFFGDEVFRWLMWDEPSTSPGKHWSRKIAYNLKEYKRFAELAAAVIQRLGIPAIELEMVGYVLGRSEAEIDTKVMPLTTDDGKKTTTGSKRKAQEQAVKVAKQKKVFKKAESPPFPETKPQSSRRTRSSSKRQP
jgi:hypothetical protein